jgi:hypothetical protein
MPRTNLQQQQEQDMYHFSYAKKHWPMAHTDASQRPAAAAAAATAVQAKAGV